MKNAKATYSEDTKPQAPGVSFPFVSSDTDNEPILDRKPVAEIHGTLMILSFLCFTIDIGAIIMKLPTSFTIHWIIQLFAALLCTSGSILGIWMSRRDQPVSRDNGSFLSSLRFTTRCILSDFLRKESGMRASHQYLGIFAYFMISAQMGTGYLHHRIFIRTSRRSTVSHIHIWAGRLIWGLGSLNSFL